MNDFVILFRNWKFAAVLVGLLALMYFGSDYTNFLQFPPIDRSDYKTVSEEFVRRSGFVTKRVGKISSLSHVGRGGASGRESYNVFRVIGEDETGVINITVTRDESDDWYVTSADLSIKGRVLEIPVKRSSGDKWRSFKLK